MNIESKEIPLLFDAKPFQLWTGAYGKFYGQDGGWMGTLVPLSVTVQSGQGRNGFTVVLLNFGVTCSWSARRHSDLGQNQAQGAPMKFQCTCGREANTMMPICEQCAEERLKGFTEVKQSH